MVKTKSNQKIHVDKLKTTKEKLGQLKEKPKSELTLRESIYFLRDQLKSALKKGYSYQDLSEILEEQEILISASTLKNYLMEIKGESASRRKRSKSVKSQKTEVSKISDSGSSLNSSSETKNTTKSKKESEQDLERVEFLNDEEVEPSLKDSNTGLSSLNSDLSSNKKESSTPQSRSSKSTKTKTNSLSSSNRDLSDDFNQY